MTIVDVTSFPYPHPPQMQDSISDVIASNETLDAANEKLAFVVQVPKAGTITDVGFLVRTVTSSGDFTVRIETRLDTGAPSGTEVTSSTSASGTISATGWKTITLGGSGVTVTEGQMIAVVINNDSGNYAIARGFNNRFTIITNTSPYADTGSGYTQRLSLGPQVVGLEYSDGSYACHPGIMPTTGIANEDNYNSNSNPDRHGNIFQVPFKCRVHGVWAFYEADSDTDFIIYDTDGTTELINISVQSGWKEGGNERGWHIFDNTTAELEANTNYRVVAKPTQASNCDLIGASVSAASHFDAWPGGQEVHKTEWDTVGSSWSQTTTERMFIGVLINGIEVPAGGGVPGNMLGGMQA